MSNYIQDLETPQAVPPLGTQSFIGNTPEGQTGLMGVLAIFIARPRLWKGSKEQKNGRLREKNEE